MSDRAAVMPHTSTNAHVHFLHCNAHFLLGLSATCEQGLKNLEDSIKEKEGALGRDSSTTFKNWTSAETATSRLIRTAADVLGPRGDEKSGVRAEWLAFCKKEELTSEMTNYRSNRFNSLFENASAIFHHREHIKDFLTNCCSSSNLKLQSVLADVSDQHLVSMLTAVALLHIYLAHPYWKLVNSDVQYYDFYKYVQVMLSNIKLWEENPDLLFDEECRGAFNGEFLGEFDTSLHQFGVESELTKPALKAVLSSFIAVTERQLKDFLPGGMFGQELDDCTKTALQHCPLTNLAGEHAFGDLDYSMLVRRHSTLHNHSTMNMLKRNGTTSWIAEQKDVSTVLAVSRKEAKRLRTKHRKQEEIVRIKLQERMAENERRKTEKQMQAAAEIQRVTESILKHGGPVKTQQDVDILFRTFGIQGLKDQLKYLKIVLKQKVKTSGSKTELYSYLIEHLTGAKPSSPPRKKRKIIKSETSSPDCSSSSSSEEEDEDAIQTPQQPFSFSSQGQWVAVFYDCGFFIGQVIDIKSNSWATIKFLTNTKSKKDYYKWPAAEDIAEVESTFIFKWDFDVLPVSSDGRIWCVPDIDSISKGYDRINTV